MNAKHTMRSNKVAIQAILCADQRLILDKIFERALITPREYNNLKSINREDAEGHVIALLDKILNKGDETCEAFLRLLQTDEDVTSTYPDLRKVQWNQPTPLPPPVQASSDQTTDVPSYQSKRRKTEEGYQLNSRPAGLCLIINNQKFHHMKLRRGSDQDAQSLAEVFCWLGFRVLMCEDQTRDQMDWALDLFASLGDLSRPREFDLKEWRHDKFADLQEAPEHGDAFVCCILSHGDRGVVFGTDGRPLAIKQILRSFKATPQSPLIGKPKVFLIQACQGGQMQPGAEPEDLESDGSRPASIPEEADFLLALATVEDYVSYRHPVEGSWFIQSLCQQLRDGCLRGEELTAILLRVNDDVSRKEAGPRPGAAKQMPEVRLTLRKRLVFSPVTTPTVRVTSS